MKLMIIKKITAVLLTAALLVSGLCICAGAESAGAKGGTLNPLSYNVSGIPIFGDTQGTQRELKGEDRMHKIGEILSTESGCDIVGVQEDFNLHPYLAEAMTAFPYQTETSGGVPLGDGLNAFAAHPIYNVKRTAWEKCYGVLSGSADRLAEKGILSCVMEIEDGVFIDFYVIHTDAGIDVASVAARKDNFRQLTEMINSREEDRALIILGDFNSRYNRNQDDDLYNNLVKPVGLTDVWAELHNGGDYTYDNGENWNPTLNESIDKVMFKNGGGVEFEPQSLEYITFTNENGETYTDHISTKVSLSYKITGECKAPASLEAPKPADKTKMALAETAAIIKALVLVFTHIHELFYLLGQGIALIVAPVP